MGDDKQMKENLLKIINNYGLSSQLKKLSEEIFELQEAIVIRERDYKSCDTTIKMDMENKKHIEEEFADCCIVLEQFKAYYNLDNDRIINIMKQKINRQLDRIEKEKNK